MKKLLIVMALIIFAATAFAQVPDYGLYEATASQFDWNGEEYTAIGRVVTFRIGYENPNEVYVLWDYDNDGSLQDENTEVYPASHTENGLVWRDDSGEYLMWEGEEGPMIVFQLQSGDSMLVHLTRLERW